jgi:hypothetical protein
MAVAGSLPKLPRAGRVYDDMLRYVIASIVVVCLQACTTVQPWERGTLAKPHMGFDHQPLQRELRQHSHESREAASSGCSRWPMTSTASRSIGPAHCR